jgi:nucleotide-binding universal stress UspA family protein
MGLTAPHHNPWPAGDNALPIPKSVLLHLDGSVRCAQRVQVACQLAEAFDLQVTGLYSVRPSLLRYPMAAAGGMQVAAELARVDDQSRESARAAFEAATAGLRHILWSDLKCDPSQGFARQALYADLMVLGQHDAGDAAADELPPDFVPTVLVDSGRPALVLPYAGPIFPIGRTVLVAWKETREAARAVSAALPWLRRAERVHVVCLGDESDGPLRRLRRLLAAHGVTLTAQHGGPESGSAGETVLSLAADVSADLLVMGCYGHGRAREWVLGGATRTILQSMTLPVLMIH